MFSAGPNPGNRQQEGHPAYKDLGSYSCSCLCCCCRPASGHTVKGVTERGPAINQGPASGHTVRGVTERGPAINQEPHRIQN